MNRDPNDSRKTQDLPAASCSSWPRRDFLKLAAAVPAVAGTAAIGAEKSSPAAEKPMPTMKIGKHTFSRLICGSNCFIGGSHLSNFVNRPMKEFFQPEQIAKTIRRCEEVGINTWQVSSLDLLAIYERLRADGGKVQLLALSSGAKQEYIDKMAKGGCLGIAHHGEVTDNLFKQGKLDEVNEYLKRIRDAGLLVGVSTHMPDVVDAIESKGWDLDYYMTCVYQRHRTEEELLKLLGHVPLPVREVYLKSDPPRMFKAIQAAKHPCLAFKILAAGRLCDRREWVEQAFKETFQSIKPSDGAIVGIYDRYSDQPAENAALARRFG